MGERKAKSAFIRDLRTALRHLYDPLVLKRSPLIDLLQVEKTEDSTEALRRLLLETIEAIKPAPQIPLNSASWRAYRILYERYVEQFSQDEVAIHLAVGTRQLRRLESQALRLLGEFMWTRYDLENKLPRQMAEKEVSAVEPPTDPDGNSPQTPSRDEELEWIRKTHPTERLDIEGLLQPVLQTVGPLLQRAAVTVECTLPQDLPMVMVRQTTLRHALSNVISVAIHATPRGGRLHISAAVQSPNVEVDIRVAQSFGGPIALARDDIENLELAQEMAALSSCSLEILTDGCDGQLFHARFRLPVAAQVRVLVIDDNADTLQLVERCLASTRYQFAGVSDPRHALEVAEAINPQVILLDVMLPGVDGWELLGRLREHPRLQGVPIIVCTILAQKELALALGAAGFMRKPISQQALLATLDRQMA